jgi:hypothetical protein
MWAKAFGFVVDALSAQLYKKLMIFFLLLSLYLGYRVYTLKNGGK